MKFAAVGTIALLVAASGAVAQDAIWTGDTTGGPTMQRPVSFTLLSGFATATPYEVTPFFVSVGGQYVFEADYRNAAGGSWDGYILVYSGSFDAGNPLSNLIAGDDDYLGSFTVLPGATTGGLQGSRIALGDGSNFGGSGTGLNLTAGEQYFAVVLGFGNADFGTYTAGIGGGQGQVTLGLIPAPGAVALLGLGGLAAVRRRR
jgi:hypothetical protein